ncbi:MAG TPA: transglycosylase domain-containing protein [Streptosporangiaceae bacterium]|nr:transglycosylase domain-containing protein [Streptosporangiaceae bacterium]
MQIPWRRAGALSGTLGRIVVMAAVAALLIAGAAVPVVGLAGVAARDVANTFDTLPVGTVGVPPSRSVIYSADGNVITYLYPNHIYRIPVTYSQIAPVMRDAIVSIEDSSFFQQGALDPRGTLRALLHNSGGSGLQGASTLAQQYVKNVRVLQAQTPAEVQAATYPNLQRKIQQLRLAADVEHEMTQQQLLAAYLNVAFFDNSAYGIEVASQVYFSVSASQLTLPEAALLAGLVQSPTTYDPFTNPANALQRRSEVLVRMWQLHYISKATEQAAIKSPLGLKRSYAPVASGCASPQAASSAFFCDYVQHVLEINYPSVWKELNTTGGLAIYTTLNTRDQLAADAAVNYVQPPYNSGANPGHNADTEVMIKPGTGDVEAIAVNRPYSTNADELDYAVNTEYGGGAGVQTGSSSKLFTLITALEQGKPFSYPIKIKAPATVGPYTNCKGGYVPPAPFVNAEGGTNGQQIWMLNQATVDSVNLYFANLEQQVGLCNVVKTAVDMGMTRADGTSLLQYDPKIGGSAGDSADNFPSFTLGSVYVSPMSMAAAYASVAARGWYCSPQAIVKIQVISSGQQLPVQAAQCHRDMPQGVADAANFILRGVLTQPGATAAGRTIPGHDAAGKTGTANGGFYAAFAGYTPTLAAYVSVFNPTNPTGAGAMIGYRSCYRDVYGESCPGQMFGDNAPAATWLYSFLRADLGPDVTFVTPPGSFFSGGNGLGAPKTVGGKKKPKNGGGGPGGGGGPTPTPTH